MRNSVANFPFDDDNSLESKIMMINGWKIDSIGNFIERRKLTQFCRAAFMQRKLNIVITSIV